jgi:hypothetical protein
MSLPLNNVPKIVFVVPYRDREQQRIFFDHHMKDFVLKGRNDYRIVYVHQCDDRSFNRGGMKNIGFLWVKEQWPNDYRNITLVFNDVDNMPFAPDFIRFETWSGNVKHFYGFKHAVGGIVSITGGDFEKTRGFPNFWAWGFEDNAFQHRILAAGLTLDRSQFFPIYDKNIMHFVDGITRPVNRKEYDRYRAMTKEGISSIQNLNMVYDAETGFLNVYGFSTPYPEDKSASKIHDMRSGPIPFKNTRGGSRWGMNFI